MRTFVILPENDMSPEQIARRKELLPAHMEFLRKNGERIWAAGPMRTEPKAESHCSMWVVKGETQDEVDAFFRTDPFFLTRSGYRILHWTRTFPETPI